MTLVQSGNLPPHLRAEWGWVGRPTPVVDLLARPFWPERVTRRTQYRLYRAMSHLAPIQFLLAIAVVGGGCCSTPPKHSIAPVAVAEPGRLQPGDQITIDIEEHAPTVSSGLRLDRTIQADGTVALVSNKVFRAAGKTLDEFRREVRHHYVPKHFQSVRIIRYLDFDVYYVGGEVNGPARLLLEGPTTLRTAILSAGGFTPSANKKKVKLIRADGERRMVDCTDIQWNREEDVEIWPGDCIIVPRAFWK
jgi:protein involved in polysaccharide export with SLBB domain